MRKMIHVLLGAAVVFSAVGSAFVPVSAERFPDVVPNQYIVLLGNETDSSEEINGLAGEHGLTVLQRYSHAVKGFAAIVPEGRLQALRRDSRVLAIVADREVRAVGNGKGKPAPSQPSQAVPSGIRRAGADAASASGAGVTVAVLDTGIDLSHPDLAANIVAGRNCINPRKSANDDNGHGSHVAGTIAGIDNGVGVVGMAPGAKLAAVKVLNAQGSGTWSSVICGIDWITANAETHDIKVANMSLSGAGTSDDACGTTDSDALHQAICASRDAGIAFVVAAGNEGVDAASSVPAAYDDAVITVSALADSDGLAGGSGSATSWGADDTFAGFSNHGSPIDIAAPGVSIHSTWKSGGYNAISGTSMATPHVAGAAALYLETHPSATWSEVLTVLLSVSEPLGAGHDDPSGLHPEPVLRASSF